MTKIIRHTRFRLDPFGDGGCKRSMQIKELLERTGMEIVNDDFVLPKGLTLSLKFKLFLKGLFFVFSNFSLKEIRNFKNLIEMPKYFGLRIPVIVEKYAQDDVLFVNENTVSGSYGLPYLMKATGKKVIALPHNLESFCGDDTQSGKKTPYWFYEDVKRMKLADHVFCISKEETWLLRLFGLNADYLPYYPPVDVEKYLLSIRLKREELKISETYRCLVLGSATNYPTKIGMEDLLNALAKYEDLPFEIHIAGFGTENLDAPPHSSFFFHGTVKKEELESLMVKSDCLIVNQPVTSGALTRIIETLIAGIPVFANLNAARDSFGLEGVRVYHTFEELYDLLRGWQLPRCVDVPHRNRAAEKLFIDAIVGH